MLTQIKTGLPDGLELGIVSVVAGAACSPVPSIDLNPTTKTNPLIADTDGDGLLDGVEDANKNGRVDEGETDPLVADSDGDLIADGVEDKNGNGIVDQGETSHYYLIQIKMAYEMALKIRIKMVLLMMVNLILPWLIPTAMV